MAAKQKMIDRAGNGYGTYKYMSSFRIYKV